MISNKHCTGHVLTLAAGHSSNIMVMVASGLFGTDAGQPCISVVRFGMDNDLHAQSTDHVATPRLTHCVLASGAKHLFAAGACALVDSDMASY